MHVLQLVSILDITDLSIVLHEQDIVHTDLKPDNVLIVHDAFREYVINKVRCMNLF